MYLTLPDGWVDCRKNWTDGSHLCIYGSNTHDTWVFFFLGKSMERNTDDTIHRSSCFCYSKVMLCYVTSYSSFFTATLCSHRWGSPLLQQTPSAWKSCLRSILIIVEDHRSYKHFAHGAFGGLIIVFTSADSYDFYWRCAFAFHKLQWAE